MKRLLTTVLLLFSCVVYAQEINVVPYPASVEIGQRRLLLNDKLSIAAQTAYLPLAELFSENLSSLTMLESRVTSKTSKGDIRFIENPSMAVDEYKIVVNEQGIEVSGCSYSELSMGGVTLLQMIESRIEGYSVAYCEIVDSPQMEYRGLMLDVARQKIDIETVKQSVNLCYWYKIKYLQIHLSDDQSFTFPSQTYPKLPTENRHYTHDELKELVEYAKLRGVIIIPEFDVPGHTTAMRNAMPELFGEGKNSVIDIASEQACQAVETIISEMMDVFYTSPYFHIGADECWFGEYAKLPHVQEYVKAKGYDSVHDIYLEFIVRLHNFVKEKGFKTMAWESFSGTGSDKVTIPDDLLMFAWETAYQTPQDLLKNGYQIINASWKPTYITPGMRWSQEYIYKWNVRRWENH
ncbi:MAG: family 20 glycosylhydrolase, partial [Rikenellaceae bacterium]